jgi:tetratricopeptide (TPR) repeat protein
MLTVKPIRPQHYSLRCLAVLAIGFCLQSASVHAADAGIEWDTLNREVTDLYRAGHYDRAIVVAKKALEVAEHNVGSHHPAVAASLNNLAELYHAKGDYEAAEPLYKRALAIWEKALGPTHPAVATSLNNLAALYRAKGD